MIPRVLRDAISLSLIVFLPVRLVRAAACTGSVTSLTGKKTINEKDIANLKTLGIAVQSQPVTKATMVFA